MAKVESRTFVWHFDSPAEAIWPILADTAKFNEAANLPKHEIEEIPQPDGSVHYFGRGRMGPVRLAWQERPVNWITNQWFRHCRDFSKGPLSLLCATLRLFPEGEGCRGEFKVEAAPANAFGRLILKSGFFEGTEKSFSALAADAERFAAGLSSQPFTYKAPSPSSSVRQRVERLVEKIEATGHGHGLAQRLAQRILAAQESELVHLRPLELARRWRVEERKAIELCLEAARCGLLILRWDLLCPRCRITKASVPGLDELPQGAHCGTCNIDYDRDFSKNVELSFEPAPAVRPISAGEYCLFGPMSTPHILAHITLAPGEEQDLAAAFPAGLYRLRTLEPGPETDVEVGPDRFPTVVLESDDVRAGPPAVPGRLVLRNSAARQLTAIVEERAWVKEALTADRVTAMQAFRDLFSDQVLRPGDEVAVGHVTLMFTDLRDSTALFNAVGDAQAYHLVRAHFAYLTGIVRTHNGAIVKTIGDAIMAAFSEPADALRAALQIQRDLETFNREEAGGDVVIKLGLHQGPTIAVTLNGRLDYFGATVNLAARLQDKSSGGDIVISQTVSGDPAVKPLLDGLDAKEETTELKGFDEAVSFLRLQP